MLPSLTTVTTDIQHYSGHRIVPLVKDAIEQVLDLAQRLTLPADQPVGFIGLDVQQEHVLVVLLGDRGFEA